MKTSALLVSLLLVGCTRASREPAPAASSAAKPATGAPEAGVVAALGVDVDDGGLDDAALLPSVAIAVPNGPAVNVRAAASALLAVSVAAGTWKAVEVERRASDGGVVQKETFERPRNAKEETRSEHAAKPGVEYMYRARVGSGPWSPEVAIRLPVPRRAPLVPADVTAVAESPYALRVAWKADTRATAGFELLVAKDGAAEHTAALVSPSARSFVLHLRIPGRRYAVRLRAFNERGISAESATVEATMPAKDPATPATPTLPPCKPLPKERDESAPGTFGMGRADVGLPGGRPLFNDPSGKNGLLRRLYGRVDGCFRELGSFELQAEMRVVEGVEDDGFPLLHAIAGAGQYAGAQLVTLRYVGGRYRQVDAAYFCGEPYPESATDPRVPPEDGGPDLTSARPPFGECQRDFRAAD